MNKRSENGFTLIELLVTVTIMAVLTGFLLPVLLAARRWAWRINCASNLKQIGQACINYSKEHSAMYGRRSPFAHSPSSYKEVYWPYENWVRGTHDPEASGRTLGLLYPVYVKKDDLRIFICPAARKDDKNPPELKSGGTRDLITNEWVYVFKTRISYAYNSIRVRDYFQKVIMAADEDAVGTRNYPKDPDDNTKLYYQPSPNHHYKGANCLWISGRVSWQPCESERRGVVMKEGVRLTDFGIDGPPEPQDELGRWDPYDVYRVGHRTYYDNKRECDTWLKILPPPPPP